MAASKALQRAVDQLNKKQREIVEHVNGPLLVIAGPGTGKTHVLPIRAANIVLNRSVDPENVLCIAYTDIEARSMRERLTDYLGEDGNRIAVRTFHSLCREILELHSECFDRLSELRPASKTQALRVMNEVLWSLSDEDPLYKGACGAVRKELDSFKGYVERFKSYGISSRDLLSIAEQNAITFDYLEKQTDALEAASKNMMGKVELRNSRVQSFVDAVDNAFWEADSSLKTGVKNATSFYRPFLARFRALVHAAIPDGTDSETIAERIEGFKKVRDIFFEGTNRDGRYFKDRMLNEQMRSAARIAIRYDDRLEELGLYDPCDLVFETARALEWHPELREELQEQYRYIQLDEFQDANDGQVRIVGFIAGEPEDTPNLLVMADDDQAVTKYENAGTSQIASFIFDYEPKQIVMNSTYRCVPALTKLDNRISEKISERMLDAKAKKLKSTKENDRLPHISRQRFSFPGIEYHALAKTLSERLRFKKKYGGDRSVGVIAKNEKTFKDFEPYLNHFSIAHYGPASDAFTYEPFCDYLAALGFIYAYARSDVQYAMTNLPELMVSEGLGVLGKQAYLFAQHAQRHHEGNWIAAMDDYDEEGSAQLKTTLLGWANLASSLTTREILEMVHEPFSARYKEKHHRKQLVLLDGCIRAFVRAVENEADIMGLAEDAKSHFSTFMAVFREMRFFHIAAPLEAGDLESRGICLSTARDAKGMEFDTVFIADADRHKWYGKRRKDALTTPSNVFLFPETVSGDDNRRLLYVTTSRAGEELCTVRHKNPYGKSRSEIIPDLKTTRGEKAEVIEQTMVDCKAGEISDWERRYWTPAVANSPELEEQRDYEVPKIRNITPEGLVRLLDNLSKEGEPGAYAGYIPFYPKTTSVQHEFDAGIRAFLQDYVHAIEDEGGRPVDEVIRSHREMIHSMDYPKAVVDWLVRRFDRITDATLPVLKEIASNRRPVTDFEVSVTTTWGVPLQAKIDLALIDDDKKEISIVDLKTQETKEEDESSIGLRLRLAKLLLEPSDDYRDYTVTDAMSLLVEPDEVPSPSPIKPVRVAIEGDEMERFLSLIYALCRRLSEEDYSDLSDFVRQGLSSQADYTDEEKRVRFIDLLIERG